MSRRLVHLVMSRYENVEAGGLDSEPSYATTVAAEADAYFRRRMKYILRRIEWEVGTIVADPEHYEFSSAYIGSVMWLAFPPRLLEEAGGAEDRWGRVAGPAAEQGVLALRYFRSVYESDDDPKSILMPLVRRFEGHVVGRNGSETYSLDEALESLYA